VDGDAALSKLAYLFFFTEFDLQRCGIFLLSEFLIIEKRDTSVRFSLPLHRYCCARGRRQAAIKDNSVDGASYHVAGLRASAAV
jgi:hypothetical protein